MVGLKFNLRLMRDSQMKTPDLQIFFLPEQMYRLAQRSPDHGRYDCWRLLEEYTSRVFLVDDLGTASNRSRTCGFQ